MKKKSNVILYARGVSKSTKADLDHLSKKTGMSLARLLEKAVELLKDEVKRTDFF